MQRISKTALAANLDRAIAHIPGEAVGIQGLNTLIQGWLKHRKYGHAYYEALRHRDWMYITEVQDLSRYAQYDLSGSPTER